MQPQLCSHLVTFHGLMCRWLLSVASGVPVSTITPGNILSKRLSEAVSPAASNDPVSTPTQLCLPLPDTVPREFAAVPEDFLETMLDHLAFVARHDPHQLDSHGSTVIDPFLTLVVATLQRFVDK